MPACKLSIVTVNLNNAAGLERTAASVVRQTFWDKEFIVVDGGSTDGSLHIIEKYNGGISLCVSEKDEGIFHAMNKGIGYAKGDYVLMLNSGDILTSNTILEEIFSTEPAADVLYTDVLWEERGNVYGYHPPDAVTFGYFFRHDFIPHQTTFIRRSLHERLGLYDAGLKLSADWKFLVLALCKHNVSYKHLPVYASQCDREGISNKPESWAVVLAERKQIFEEHFPAFLSDYTRLNSLQTRFDAVNRRLYNRVVRRIGRLLQKATLK